MKYIYRYSIIVGLAVLALVGCPSAGAGDQDAGTPEGEIAVTPSCSSVVAANGTTNPLTLFGSAVVDPTAISHAIVFGEMTAGDYTPVNNETGFGFPVDDDNLPVTAPADMYVRSFEYNDYLTGWRAGESDYSISFGVCSAEINGLVVDAVDAQLHHVTGLSPELETLFAGLSFTCKENDAGSETLSSCTYFYKDDYYLIEEGTVIGTAGGTGTPSSYDPGLDFNLVDRRYTNVFVNPDRLGAEEGPGAGYRYGAPLYEYFSTTTRDAYRERVGSIPQPENKRVSTEYPSGQLSGIGQAGTAAGVWIREDKAGLTMEDNLIELVSHVLVLADHNFAPDTELMLSTDLTSIADVAGVAQLVQFPAEETGDLNTRFTNTAPGEIYCYSGNGFRNESYEFFYYVQLVDGGQTLLVERLYTDCSGTVQVDRVMTVAAVRFVR